MKSNRTDDVPVWKKYIKIVFHIWRQFDDPYYAGFAASIAYFFFMASIPTMIVLTQLLGIFDVSMDFIKDWLEVHINSQLSSFVMGLFQVSSVKLSNVFLIVVALWSASSLEFSLARLTSHVLSEGTYRFNFWSERFKAIPTAIFTIATIAVALVLYVYGEQLRQRFLISNLLAKIALALRLPIVAGMIFLMVVVNYYILPRIRVPIRAVLPGAVVAFAGIMIVTVFYNIYIGHAANYNILYGAFASIIAMMLWFYLMSWVLCIGMMFNKAWDEVMERGRLTREKLMIYLERQMIRSNVDYAKFFIHEDDFLNSERDTIAVRMSRKFVEGYDQELESQKQKVLEKKIQEQEAQDLYEEEMMGDL